MKFTLLLCLALLSVTCSDDDRPNTCSVVNPVRELDWLKEKIESMKNGPADIMVEQGTYQDQTVFTFTLCCPACLMIADGAPPPVYTCEGNTVDNLFKGDPLITDVKTIYRTPPWKALCW